MIQNRKTLDIPDFWLANKSSLTVYALMHLCIIILALLDLLHFPSLHKSLVYPPLVYILYDECSEECDRGI